LLVVFRIQKSKNPALACRIFWGALTKKMPNQTASKADSSIRYSFPWLMVCE
jgi:hypothetical protein